LSLGEGGSPYENIKNDRVKVNNLVFGGEPKRDFPRCPICIEQWRLELFTSDSGKRMAKCIRGCGQLFDLETMQNQEDGGTMLVPSKYTSRYGSTQKHSSFIISQGHKKKSKQTGSINDQLSEADREDIQTSTGMNVS
jgi:hypothetical protein